MKPNSSQIIAKMKSVCASGRKKSFCRLSIRPTPENPPDPTAMSDCSKLKAVALRVGTRREEGLNALQAIRHADDQEIDHRERGEHSVPTM